MEKLYKNKSDKWGTETYTMTWNEWRKTMMPDFEIWFREWLEEEPQGCGGLNQAMIFNSWVETQMKAELEEVEEIGGSNDDQ